MTTMTIEINQWHDALRILAFFANVWSLVLLVRAFLRRRGDWSQKTLDYWYALTMWSLAGAILSIQGVVMDLPLTPTVIFVTAASLVSIKGLYRKGTWGWL